MDIEMRDQEKYAPVDNRDPAHPSAPNHTLPRHLQSANQATIGSTNLPAAALWLTLFLRSFNKKRGHCEMAPCQTRNSHIVAGIAMFTASTGWKEVQMSFSLLYTTVKPSPTAEADLRIPSTNNPSRRIAVDRGSLCHGNTAPQSSSGYPRISEPHVEEQLAVRLE